MHKLVLMVCIFSSDIIEEPKNSLPLLRYLYHGNGSICKSIIFYNSFTISLRFVSLRAKYVRMPVTLKLFDIENIKQCLFIAFQLDQILCRYFALHLLISLFPSFLKCYNEYYKVMFF